ncbi:hypothetical protein H257_16963 [Aphanomyces astaci]|uniref:Uncharacterized protein n=1 Tax=Aphanomyces astaci TaxID=112090 RepID=W4FIK7_APHAT|nr:hypothetical protein H257_16963 [Aphanomyces astaci]ETV66661.1 hypothetical protein H257_16963 [Aphanomyces astaci]|eukprot:XP_009843889.1 hypothetical protein H257_16963 [Aphanomyces astaci]
MLHGDHATMMGLISTDPRVAFMYDFIGYLVRNAGPSGMCPAVWSEFVRDMSFTSVAPNGLLHDPHLDKIATVWGEVYNSSLAAVVASCGYMRKDNFMLFLNHYMTTLNKRRIQAVIKESASQDSIKRQQWRTINQYIHALQQDIRHHANEPQCTATTPCKLCSPSQA